MDINATGKKLLTFLKKYKYIVILVLVGVILLLIPTEKNSTKAITNTVIANVTSTDTINQDLAILLSKVKGAGKVEVYLMAAEGEETIYQTDESDSTDTSGSSTHSQTVIVADSQRNENGLIKQINPPKYNGAIIVCEGADNADVQLQLIRAVANLTGLGTNKISVLKMK